MLYFITGNKNKFAEIKSVIPEIEQLDIDLPEIQELDPKAIIEAKLKEAFNHVKGEFIVEDTSLYLNAMNGLPGPLIKWFMKTIGNDGIANLAEKLGNNRGEAKTYIGYAKNPHEIQFFEGSVSGQIVKPRGETNFGWDPIFLADGKTQTFAEMPKAEKNEISMRRMAAEKLKEHLKK
ncbi:MAG: non-canonical purine NTP pyrophosphatase [bacterium]